MRNLIDKLRILFIFLADAVNRWEHEILENDIDSPYCCDGRECGCGGTTIREAYFPGSNPNS